MSVPIHARVQAMEGETVHLSLEDGQTLHVPQSACEGTPKVGAEVRVLVAIPGSEDAARHELAQHLLNELLGKKHS